MSGADVDPGETNTHHTSRTGGGTRKRCGGGPGGRRQIRPEQGGYATLTRGPQSTLARGGNNSNNNRGAQVSKQRGRLQARQLCVDDHSALLSCGSGQRQHVPPRQGVVSHHCGAPLWSDCLQRRPGPPASLQPAVNMRLMSSENNITRKTAEYLSTCTRICAYAAR